MHPGWAAAVARAHRLARTHLHPHMSTYTHARTRARTPLLAGRTLLSQAERAQRLRNRVSAVSRRLNAVSGSMAHDSAISRRLNAVSGSIEHLRAGS